MTWPHLIGGSVACVSLGSCTTLVAYFVSSHRDMDWPLLVAFWLLSVVSISLLPLSYFLWSARPWALRALIVLCWFLASSIVLFFVTASFRRPLHATDIFVFIGELVVLASPPVWFSLMLRHSDVTRSFVGSRSADQNV